jgi:hypothetical protein
VKATVYETLRLYAAAPYEYLSAAALETYKSGIVAQVNPLNPKRFQIGVPNPIIQEYLGSDVELFLIYP